MSISHRLQRLMDSAAPRGNFNGVCVFMLHMYCMHPKEHMDSKQVGTYCTQVVSTHPASGSILALSQLK